MGDELGEADAKMLQQLAEGPCLLRQYHDGLLLEEARAAG